MLLCPVPQHPHGHRWARMSPDPSLGAQTAWELQNGDAELKFIFLGTSKGLGTTWDGLLAVPSVRNKPQSEIYSIPCSLPCSASHHLGFPRSFFLGFFPWHQQGKLHVKVPGRVPHPGDGSSAGSPIRADYPATQTPLKPVYGWFCFPAGAIRRQVTGSDSDKPLSLPAAPGLEVLLTKTSLKFAAPCPARERIPGDGAHGGLEEHPHPPGRELGSTLPPEQSPSSCHLGDCRRP